MFLVLSMNSFLFQRKWRGKVIDCKTSIHKGQIIEESNDEIRQAQTRRRFLPKYKSSYMKADQHRSSLNAWRQKPNAGLYATCESTQVYGDACYFPCGHATPIGNRVLRNSTKICCRVI